MFQAYNFALFRRSPTTKYGLWNWAFFSLGSGFGTKPVPEPWRIHYRDVTMGMMASQITSLTIVYSTVYSDQRKYQSSASPAFVQGIHRWPVNSPHKCPVTRKMFPFDVIMHEFSTWEEIPMKFETPSYFPNHCRPSVGALNTNFNGIWNKTHIILFNKMHLKMLCAQCHHNVQAHWSLMTQWYRHFGRFWLM